MDRVREYRQIIKRILDNYAELSETQNKSGVETVLVFDDERGNYLWLRVGWAGDSRVRNLTVYVRLRNGKFWIEEDWTEQGIATDLLNAGVPNQDIVLAFQPPELRALTEFATA
ncbi:MAG: XisI protein [Chloroflexi bacterium]|nr:XisI protein [Chloroflexota bacterium]